MLELTYKNKRKLAARIISCTAVLLCMAAIFAFSSQDADESSSVSGSFIEKIAPLFVPGFRDMTADNQTEAVESMQHIVRKGAHASVYCLLGILTSAAFLAFDRTPLKGFLSAVLVCLLYAISDEVHQYFVPGRSMRLGDVLIDLSGSVVGSAALNWFYSVFIAKRKKN